MTSAEPWLPAALRFAADPAPGAALPLPPALGWLADSVPPPLRPRAVAALCGPAGDLSAFARPGVRLLTLPAGPAARLLRFVAAWWDAPRLAGLLRRAEVAAAREAFGADAHAFAFATGALLPRPSPVMEAAAPPSLPPLRRAAALFGAAAGPLPRALAARLALRGDPWDAAAAAPALPDAWSTLRRIGRHAVPDWPDWTS